MIKMVIFVSLLTFSLAVVPIVAGSESGEDISREEMGKGRISLILTSTAYGAGLYGWGIPYMFDADSGRIYVGSEMVSTFGAFALGLMTTRNYKLGPTVAKMIQRGSIVGTLYGLAIPALFGAENEDIYLIATMAVTPLGALGGYELARHRSFTSVDAELITFGSLIGVLYGLGTTYLVNIEDMGDTDQARVYAGSAMMGVPLGALAFSELSRRIPTNKGRARLVELGALMGAYYGYGFTYLADPEEDRPYVAAMMGGLPLGTLGASLLTRSGNYANGRDLLIILGAVLGGGFGTGLAYLFGAEQGKPLIAGSLLGAPTGIVTAAMLTRNFGKSSKRADSGMEPLESISGFADPFSLAIFGLQCAVSKRVKHLPVRMEICRMAF